MSFLKEQFINNLDLFYNTIKVLPSWIWRGSVPLEEGLDKCQKVVHSPNPSSLGGGDRRIESLMPVWETVRFCLKIKYKNGWECSSVQSTPGLLPSPLLTNNWILCSHYSCGPWGAEQDRLRLVLGSIHSLCFPQQCRSSIFFSITFIFLLPFLLSHVTLFPFHM